LQYHECEALIPGAHGPIERPALVSPFVECRPIGGDRLLEPRRAALALAQNLALNRPQARDEQSAMPVGDNARECLSIAQRDPHAFV